jgi:hypothetical protein
MADFEDETIKSAVSPASLNKASTEWLSELMEKIHR